MSNYRMVARHVRYWRGVVHRWSTVYQFTGTLASGSYAAAIAVLATMEGKVNYCQSGAVDGGLYEIALYNSSSGGVPVAVATYFPYATPGSWIPYTSTGWAVTSSILTPAAETSLQVEWAAGLSSSGKPVHYRKWYHSVPQVAGTEPTQDIPSGTLTSLTTAFTTGIAGISALGIQLGSGSRLAATTPVVSPFYGSHQMPRGRRRKVAKLTSDGAVRFPAGLLIVPGSDGSLS